jgi:hypothetical protein
MRHFRVALYDVTSGSPDEVIELARAGFRPIFETQPGFVRYEVGARQRRHRLVQHLGES